MVSTITPASACRDLLEIAVRLVRLLKVINNLYFFFTSVFDFLFFLCVSFLMCVDTEIKA